MTPRLHEALVRLSTHIPSFAKAAKELAWFTGAQIHSDTARAHTEAAGAMVVAYETREAERILREQPAPPCAPDRLLLSVDGAMVPLVHGQWTEVRTLAVGEVQPPQKTADGPVVHTTKLSYFSRRTDSARFGELATLELHRRGLEGARQVGVVADGALWCQSFADLHYGEALRILDFAHAAEYLSAIAQSSGANGPLLSAPQLVEMRHALKEQGAAVVLPQLRALVATVPDTSEVAGSLAYLESRQAQMDYPRFVAEGWPIGSGMVESANKLVVEDRLKGAGMHWAEANVNPLLALRNAVCNDRWEECWRVIEREQRRQVSARRQARCRTRAAARGKEAPARAAAPPAPACPRVRPLEPEVKSAHHPWKRAWSIRRQREVADQR
ncbi:ISKra4 family transposase [Kouleothrix sp.]|uniref:ISKra4 family transposase n=1 Tax=Kouleothrix sp. TaxID=2779161 RepID=UPI00391CBBE6